MGAIIRISLRLSAGLLLAGLLAQFAVVLPNAWHSPALIFLITIACVAMALMVGRGSRTRPRG